MYRLIKFSVNTCVTRTRKPDGTGHLKNFLRICTPKWELKYSNSETTTFGGVVWRLKSRNIMRMNEHRRLLPVAI